MLQPKTGIIMNGITTDSGGASRKPAELPGTRDNKIIVLHADVGADSLTH
jgi:hypothetical protein